jgi:hypothetical protein
LNREFVIVSLLPFQHTREPMKAISASIIVLAAAVLMVGGSHLVHGQTRGVLQLAACVVGILGMCGWIFWCGRRDGD